MQRRVEETYAPHNRAVLYFARADVERGGSGARQARLPACSLWLRWSRGGELYRELGVFAVAVLERHLERRLRSAAALG